MFFNQETSKKTLSAVFFLLTYNGLLFSKVKRLHMIQFCYYFTIFHRKENSHVKKVSIVRKTILNLNGFNIAIINIF